MRAVAAGISLFLVGTTTLVLPAMSSPAGATATPLSGCTNPPSTLATGQTLSPGACLVSQSKDYELVMQTDGNLVLYYQSQADPLWDSRTDGNPGATATLQTDGNLVVYAANGTTPLWAATTSGRAPDANLVLQDDGNLVLYGTNPGGSAFAAWSTATENLRGFELQPNQVLEPGQYLESKNGDYGLEMGTGGVLVLFRTENGNTQGAFRCPLWSEPAVTGANPVTYQYDTTNPIGTTISQSTVDVGTYPYTKGDTTPVTPSPSSYLTMVTDGNLAMISVDSTPVVPWASSTTDLGSYAVLQTDGNFVILSAAGSPLWSTFTSTSGDEDQGWAMCTGSTLEIGQRIYATPWYSGTYLTMQKTCNLVLYNSSNTPLWDTNTDVTDSANFTRTSNDSTLDGQETNSAYYTGCYAVMEGNGSLALFAPNCGPPAQANDYHGCAYDGEPNEIWSSGTTDAAVVKTQSGSFGPFLAFPTNAGVMNIVNAAGYQVASDPVVDDPNNRTDASIGKEITSYVLMVVGALL